MPRRLDPDEWLPHVADTIAQRPTLRDIGIGGTVLAAMCDGTIRKPRCTHQLAGDGLRCVRDEHKGRGHVYESAGGDIAGQEPGGEQ